MPASRNDIANLLALAEIMDAQFDCGLEAALKNIQALMRPEQPEAAPEPASAPQPEKVLRPFNQHRFAAFLDRAPVGAEWTAPGICEHLGMAFPQYAKHPAQLMIRRGWVAVGIHSGCRLYRKQAVVADAAQ